MSAFASSWLQMHARWKRESQAGRNNTPERVDCSWSLEDLTSHAASTSNIFSTPVHSTANPTGQLRQQDSRDSASDDRCVWPLEVARRRIWLCLRLQIVRLFANAVVFQSIFFNCSFFQWIERVHVTLLQIKWQQAWLGNYTNDKLLLTVMPQRYVRDIRPE